MYNIFITDEVYFMWKYCNVEGDYINVFQREYTLTSVVLLIGIAY